MKSTAFIEGGRMMATSIKMHVSGNTTEVFIDLGEANDKDKD